MLDKMLGVSPPLKGEAPNSKLANGKDLTKETLKSDYKKDFEKALKHKLELKKEANQNSEKEVNRKDSELRADKKDKKSLGGTKKKVTEDDDNTIVSNVMASKENKVETPDSKIEDLAEIDVDIKEKNKMPEQAEVFSVAQLGLAEVPLTKPADINLTPTELKNAAFEAIPKAMPDIVNADNVPTGLTESKTNDVLQPLESQSSFQSELEASVDFNSDINEQKSGKDLLEKMKNFDADKNLKTTKSDSFEQSVLNRLQNEQLLGAGAVSGQNLSDQANSNSEQKNSEQLKDLKSELTGTNQMHQAAGQSHTEFKTQLMGTSTAADTTLSKLEANREANISEVMGQAQYLVKKGGGEVVVRMSPEGLGEVHLKVILQDGKLNIEMQTQDKNVKKLIEDSLAELKSGLAANRLSLEHVKIDTVNATNADNNMQFQSNLSHGGSEGRAQEFWKDFQGNMNNQSGRKDSYAGAEASARAVPQDKVSQVMSAKALRTYGGTKGATVNRVA